MVAAWGGEARQDEQTDSVKLITDHTQKGMAYLVTSSIGTIPCMQIADKKLSIHTEKINMTPLPAARLECKLKFRANSKTPKPKHIHT
ncbi:unnamed protein product [Protopolystoma xenopodis]|uniref:Uncharacterized protein n=1 Tax=Protopolystoma xenopodis TaxID=117903 RepID=A0A448X6E7_9PLAT|nr:unnamed protein product [Protopolystoma xenopodis]